jgi:hypothetical protein
MEDTAVQQAQSEVIAKPVKSTDVFRVETNSIVENMVTKIVSGEKLTPGELRDLQERKIKSLDPDDRDRIRSVQEKLGNLAERFGKRIKGLQFQASKKELQSMQSQTFNEAARNEFAGDGLFLREVSAGLEQDWKEQQDIAYREMWHDAEGGEVVKVDPFTGLKTRDSLMGRVAKNVVQWQKTGEEKWLNKVRVKAGDLDNFKQGNDILGHDGFDNFLKNQLADKIKQVAVYTGSAVYEEELKQELIDEMFPPDSKEREQLDSLKGKVVVDGYRMKSGADEIFAAYEKVDIDTPEEEFDRYVINADNVFNRVLSSCVIGRYEKEAETTIIRDKFEDSPLALRVRRSDTNKGDYSMVSFEEEYWNGCAKELATYLAYSGMGDPIVTNDPPAVLRMSAGMTPARKLSEGVDKFTSGENFTGKQVINGESRGGAGYGLDESKVKEYEDAVMASATRKLASVGAGNEDEVRETIERAAVDKVTGYFLEVLMDEADDKSKPQGKRDLVVRAWSAKPGTVEAGELALQLGSLAVAGRLEKAVATREERVAVLRETIQTITERAVEEASKLKKYLADQDVYIPTSTNYPDAGMAADAIRRAGEQGDVDTDTLYIYYSLFTQADEYNKKFDKSRDLYNQKGVNLIKNAVEMPQIFNEVMLNEIRIARHRQYKSLGVQSA